jgi:hypothetical protein
VVPGVQVRGVLQGREEVVTRVVEPAYRLHGEAQTINPESMLRPTLAAVPADCRPRSESPGSLRASPDVASGQTPSTMDGMIRPHGSVAVPWS